MPLSTAQQVRSRIQDYPKYADYTRYGDGTASRFTLEHTNLVTPTAYVAPGGTAWSATGCTFNSAAIPAYVDFSATIPRDTAVRVSYQWTVFSDDEIGHFTAVGVNVAGAALEAIRALRFDGLKRARWMSPDGGQFDDTNAISELGRIESALKVELEENAIVGGSIYSWSETQGDS